MNEFINVDCLTGLRGLPDESVNCCVTSPPYYGLRDYGHDDQLGQEATPSEYIEKMTEIFTEVRRVLKSDGTLWINLGDTYNGYPGGVVRGGKLSVRNQHARQHHPTGYGLSDKSLKPKDLIGIPWMVAFALRSSGWYLRQDIIWSKPNPMPESVKDRCTKSHEYIFLLSKSEKYYYDQVAIKVPITGSTIQRLNQNIEAQEGSGRVPGKTNGKMKAVSFGAKKMKDRVFLPSDPDYRGGHEQWKGSYMPAPEANKKSVWSVATRPFSEAHFATFPERLVVDMIKAGCPEEGVVLDPFSGAGTTALVARKLNRNFIAFEINPEYIDISKKRLSKELGLFL